MILFLFSSLRCILANDTEKLYVPSNLEADSYETSEFYVRHMHNQECPDQLLRLPSEDKIYFSGTHLCKENGGFQILDLIITELKSHMTC